MFCIWISSQVNMWENFLMQSLLCTVNYEAERYRDTSASWGLMSGQWLWKWWTTHIDVDLLSIDLKPFGSKWCQLFEQRQTIQLHRALISDGKEKKEGEKMSLITWNWQEASVFIIISAKVSVMDLECSWETSARNWAKGKDERPVAFPPPLPDFLTKCRHRLSWIFYPPGWSSGQILVASGSWNILDVFQWVISRGCILLYVCVSWLTLNAGNEQTQPWYHSWINWSAVPLFTQLMTACSFLLSGSIRD